MNSSAAVVQVSGVWPRVQGAGRFVRPTDRKASDSTRVSASGRSTTLPSRLSRTLRNRLTRRTVSADRSHGSAPETRSLPERIVFLAALWCPLLSPRAPATGTPGACPVASLPFNDSSLCMRSITIGASNPSHPRQKCHKKLSRRSLASHTAQFAALNAPVPVSSATPDDVCGASGLSGDLCGHPSIRCRGNHQPRPRSDLG
jgi:hypothetical protein